MKKHHFIYFILLCLIAIGCENTVLEEEVPATQAVTRSSITQDEFDLYNSIFYNIQTDGIGMTDTYRIKADINTFPQDVEYDFTLWCQLKGDVKCVVWASSGEISYNSGKNYPSIYGVSGQNVNFTLKFNSPITTIQLALETDDYLNNYYKEANVKLYFSGARYKGETMGVGGFVEGGSYDLCLHPIYPYNPPNGTTEYHWKCSHCGAINDRHNTNCLGCGQ